MTTALTFAPDQARAVAIDSLMRHKLADSLVTIAAEAESLEPPLRLEIEDVIEVLRETTFAPPALWGLYGNLCRAIALDDMTAACAACGAMRDLTGRDAPRRLCNLTDEDLGRDAAALFAQAVDDDPKMPLALRPVGSSVVQRVANELAPALDLMVEASPDLAGEVDVFGRQIVLAKGRPGGTIFSGAATIFLWGAVVINPDEVKGRVQLFEALAHECGHALLTGLTGGLDVTENDPSERFTSPLRVDPRPMEGIAHATFVLARIVHALDLLTNTTSLTGDEPAQVAAMKTANLRHFLAGAEIVQKSARLTREGRAIFGDCFDAMRQFA